MWRWWLIFAIIFAVNASAQVPDWFFAAEGVQTPDDLNDYQRAGMTFLWVQVPYRPDGDFSDCDALLNEADKRGLPYLLALDLRPPVAMRQNMRCSPNDVAYLSWLRIWLDIAIHHFRNRENLLGYVLGREVDEFTSYDDDGFALFLKSRYQTLENLSRAWGLTINSWQISQRVAMHLDDENSPLSYGRPSFDAALYRWATLQNLLSLWANEVRIRDPNLQHWLFAGPLTTYRSLAAVPPDYQGIIPYISPERAEADWLAHNCHAVVIARRGGRFIAIPMLTTKLKDGRLVLPEALIRWAMASIAMGAKGVILSNWSAVAGTTTIIRDNFAALSNQVQSEIPNDMRPTTRIAVLYTPFGEGVLDAQGFPLYGFALLPSTPTNPPRLSWDEPASLFFSLRFNPYGTIDSITPFELTPEFLSRYRVLFAPITAYLEPTMQVNLANFVANGGIVVSDLGLGSFQANIPFQSFPPLLRELFGVTDMASILAGPNIRANMVVANPHPLFPRIPQGFRIGNPMGAFGPIFGLMLPTKAHYWALLIPMSEGKFERRGDRAKILSGIPGRAAVLINNYGRGFTVFAPTLLWALWSPMDVGFDLFHSSLIERSSSLRLITNSFVPTAWMSETDKGILVVNPTNSPQQVRILWRTPIFYALTNAFVRPINLRPLVQEVSLLLRPNDWAFLKPIADLSLPIEVAAETLNMNEFKLKLGISPSGKVTIRFWLPPEVRRLNAQIEHKGETKEDEITPDQWGRFVLENVPTPATVTAKVSAR